MSVSMIRRPQSAGTYQHSQFAHTHKTFGRNTTQQSAANRTTRHQWHWNEVITLRASRRRIPWLAAGGVGVTATAAWGVVALFDTADVPSMATAGVMAAFPAIYTAIGAQQTSPRNEDGSRPRVGKWWPDLAASTLAACGLVFWVGLAGPSFLAALALLLGTVLGASRWWLAHPVGPRTPSLEPEPEPVPAAPPVPAPTPAHDPYVVAWDTHIANRNNGKVPGSYLSYYEGTDFKTVYDVHLTPGQQTHETLQANARVIAGGLGHNRRKVFFQPGGPDDAENVARMTIIERDPVSEVRYYSGPTVVGGEIHNLARYTDGEGELSITMWDNDGTKSVMVAGGMGGGKSAATNALATASLSTRKMNLLYIDPKGNSSTALRKRARIAIIGQHNAIRAPELLRAMADARSTYSQATDQDVLLPSASEPGWTVLHDEFSLVSGDTKTRVAWAQFANIVRALGFWLIGVNQALHTSKWGDDMTRAAFGQQVIAFRINSNSDDLVPGLEYRPKDLPVDSKGHTIPGIAVQAGVERPNVPAKWDHLPRDNDDTCPDAPYRVSEAFDTFFDQPEMLRAEYDAIVAVLGPPNADGTWIVGGPDGTHNFPSEDSPKAKGNGKPTAARKPTGFGLATPKGDEDDEQQDQGEHVELSPVQSSVLAVIDGGTEQVAEIVEAAKASRSAVNDALTKLAALGLVDRYETGRYRRL